MVNNKDNALTTTKQIPLAKTEALLPEGLSWDALQENLKELDSIQFPRIRITDGKFYFSQDDEDGSTEFEGVIHSFVKQNTYWAAGYDPKNIAPPECYSLDGKKGSKYGECKTCQFNMFGSSSTGKGKACRNQIKLYIQLDGKAIPLTMLISPVNISAFQQNYIVDTLAQRGIPYWKAKTKFSIAKRKGEQFGRIKCELVGEFREQELEKIKQLREFWLKIVEEDTQVLEAGAGVGESPAAFQTEDSNMKSSGKVITPKSEAKPVADDEIPF